MSRKPRRRNHPRHRRRRTPPGSAPGLVLVDERQLVQRTDRERQAFKQKYFHHNSADPHEYDFVINVEKLGQQDAAELIVSAVRCWLKKSGLRSVISETVVAQPPFQLNPQALAE